MNKYWAHPNFPFCPSQVFVLSPPASPRLVVFGIWLLLLFFQMDHVQTSELHMFCSCQFLQVSFLLVPSVCFLTYLSRFVASRLILIFSAFSISPGCWTLAAHSDASSLNDDWSLDPWPAVTFRTKKAFTRDYGPADSPAWPCLPAHFSLVILSPQPLFKCSVQLLPHSSPLSHPDTTPSQGKTLWEASLKLNLGPTTENPVSEQQKYCT